MRAISLFCGAGGMDAGFAAAGAEVLWANELNEDAAGTYRANHPGVPVECADIRIAKAGLAAFRGQNVGLVFGGPPCQGFSVAGKMDPDDERNTLIWEFFDAVEAVAPRLFVMENVKALGTLARWEDVRQGIFQRAEELGYACFSRVLNASDFGVPQKRERVFFIGVQGPVSPPLAAGLFDARLDGRRARPPDLRQCLLEAGAAGSPDNPLTCTAKISLASKPVVRRSPYAGMLFNGMGRPMNLDELANTLPASMGGNKTPIVDERLLRDPGAENWIANYHRGLLSGGAPDPALPVPPHLRRLTIKEAAAIQTFPPDYVFRGEKSSVYRQIGNAVPCRLAQAVAGAVLELGREVLGIAV